MPSHVRIELVVPLPGCGHMAQLRCRDDVSDMYERGIPGWALNLNSTRYPDHGPLQGKISTAELGIEPGN
jgi:hypothetical protein